MVLVLDLPPPPLFQDEMEQNIIPQVLYLISIIYFILILFLLIHINKLLGIVIISS